MYLKEDHHSYIHNFKYAVAKRKPEKKIQACTEFEALTWYIELAAAVFFKRLQQNGLQFPDDTQLLAKETL